MRINNSIKIALNKAFVKHIRENTLCELCGGLPVEWHNPSHIISPWKRISSLVNRGSIPSIKHEISQCQALCRSCHMKEDGRLIGLLKKAPNQKGSSFPPKQCINCNKLYKPLRQGQCYTCYERHRICGRAFKHIFSDGCCGKADWKEAWAKFRTRKVGV